MTDNIEVSGTDYEINGDPTLRTVRNVQDMQMEMIRKYVSEESLRQMDSLSDEDIVEAIMDEGGFEAFQDVMWERSMLEPIQTISLAVDHVFDADDFEDTPASEFKEMQEVCSNALGGEASDFFEDLGIGMSLSEEEAIQQARNLQNQ